jgi:hypothetical protein
MLLVSEAMSQWWRKTEVYYRIQTIIPWYQLRTHARQSEYISTEHFLRLTLPLVVKNGQTHGMAEPILATQLYCSETCREYIQGISLTQWQKMSDYEVGLWLFNIGYDQYGMNRFDEAASLWQMARRVYPETAFFHTMLADLMNNNLVVGEAETVLQECKRYAQVKSECVLGEKLF